MWNSILNHLIIIDSNLCLHLSNAPPCVLDCRQVDSAYCWAAMKTTLDLPDHPVQLARQHLLWPCCSIKQLVAEFIRLGLHGDPSAGTHFNSEVVTLDPRGLPVFRAQAAAVETAIDLDTTSGWNRRA